MNTPSSIPNRTRHVARYQWRQGLMDSTPGYRLQGTAGHWIWLSREDAWEAAQELATLLDEDAAAVESTAAADTVS
ncbi:hypothetical protein [Kocuria marina]|uniref:hypothetical protein n=1 Tax=Kocuria marina TaxID=223184 RepID=UPI0021A3C6ED|nr:hypothetical protein [Kocuria marina]MCT1615730.1 hypothetical protein [Kocuria marina]